MKVWIGMEEEGKFLGIPTLFIGSPKIKFEQIKNLDRKYSFDQIYFGAGKCTKINYDTVRHTVDKCSEYIITIEVDVRDIHTIPKDIITNININIILTINNINIRECHKEMIQIKIQSLNKKKKYLGMLDVNPINEVDITNLDGKKYKGDKVLIR